MKFLPRVAFVTLAVDNVEKATRFYESLGWRRSRASQAAVTFFGLDNMVLALFGRAALAADSGVAAAAMSPPGHFGNVTLAQNFPSEAAVDAVIEQARAAGATVVKAPGATDWGGYHGVFTDPDGHLWEICHNPYFPLADDGTITLPS